MRALHILVENTPFSAEANRDERSIALWGDTGGHLGAWQGEWMVLFVFVQVEAYST